MENEIIKFISQYIDLSREEAEAIIDLDLIRNYPKGTLLLQEGEVCKECFLVLQGCVRSYYLIDGEEQTTEFFEETQLIYSVSYMKNTPSEYYLECLEDSIICIGNTEKTQQMVSKVPRLERIGQMFNSDLMVKNQVNLDKYLTLSPEKRYLKLLETRPTLCNRVPQYYLASYLGIKPESLSRIRKRLMTNKA